jgi:hypothetical protein
VCKYPLYKYWYLCVVIFQHGSTVVSISVDLGGRSGICVSADAGVDAGVDVGEYFA